MPHSHLLPLLSEQGLQEVHLSRGATVHCFKPPQNCRSSAHSHTHNAQHSQHALTHSQHARETKRGKPKTKGSAKRVSIPLCRLKRVCVPRLSRLRLFARFLSIRPLSINDGRRPLPHFRAVLWLHGRRFGAGVRV